MSKGSAFKGSTVKAAIKANVLNATFGEGGKVLNGKGHIIDVLVNKATNIKEEKT